MTILRNYPSMILIEGFVKSQKKIPYFTLLPIVIDVAVALDVYAVMTVLAFGGSNLFGLPCHTAEAAAKS